MTPNDASRYAELLRASTELLAAMRTTLNSPEYQRVWKLYEVHGFTYSGPDFMQEAAACYALLAEHMDPAPPEDPT